MISLPSALQLSLDRCLEGVSATFLQNHFETLSQIYRKGGTSESIFTHDGGCLAYLTGRMPATFGAVSAVLAEMKVRLPHWQGKSMLDWGSGPGTASWAALEYFPSIVKPILLDRSQLAIRWGKRLASDHPVLGKGEWILQSSPSPLPPVDLIFFSYTLNELQETDRLIQSVWDGEIPLMVVVEPGTPTGFQKLKRVREQWIRLGGHLVAPCPHHHACPIQKGDWCHFSARISRTKLHRLLKMGELGYEDEKFSYLIASRSPCPKAGSRILRHPIKNKGHVQMVLCKESGSIENKTISRKEGGLYRIARDSTWGDVM